MSWVSKLESKLSSLTDTSSQESIVTVAKWICFNRKQAASFCQVLGDKLQVAASDKRQLLMIEIISSVLLNDKDSSAWDRGADLRRMLGETVLLPTLSKLSQSCRDKVLAYTKVWDEANAFGGPTLIHQMRKQLTSTSGGAKEEIESKEPAEQAAPTTKQTAPLMLSSTAADTLQPEDDEFDLTPLMKKPRTATSTAAADAVLYDYDASEIPFVKTEPFKLVESCAQVANLQIAKDIRNDSAILLNSLFTALPEDVRRSCAEAAEDDDGDYALADDDTARDYSLRVNQSLIDMDMKDQLLNLSQLRKLVQQQREARQNALKLLIQSRCKFGSDEAAAAFYTADRGQEELTNRRQILLDAMELEGFGLEDEAENEQQKTTLEPGLEPLTWYTPRTDDLEVE